jgi:tRNA-binding protein
VAEDTLPPRPDHGPTTPPPKPDVGAARFAALDLRVGRILAVAPFPEARRPAYRLTIDLGPLGHRHSSAQITTYPPEELEGRQVVVAANLGRKRIAGFVSEVLVLGGLAADGSVRLLEVDGDLPPGSVVA